MMIKSRVYISTGAFEIKEIERILEIAEKNDIRNIEISPGLNYKSNTIEIVRSASKDFNFLIHNYFPTQYKPFALNLASIDSDIVERSINMCYENIDLVEELGINLYSIHCGFCFDTDGRALGNSQQVDLPRIPMHKAKRIFVSNLQKICDYAEKKGVTIALENNVVGEFARGQSGLFLGVTDKDIIELLNLTNKKNLKVLVDIAHAKVSGTVMGFELDTMLERLHSHIAEIHISENDGKRDQNLPLTPRSDTIEMIRGIEGVPITLEVYNLSVEKIKEQIQMVEERIIK